MFNDSCSRLLLTTVWSLMWSTIWSLMWSYAVWKQYPTNVDCFDSTIDLVVAIVALSTYCGFKVIEDNRRWYVSWRRQSWWNNAWWWYNVGSGSHVRHVSSFHVMCYMHSTGTSALVSWCTADSTEQMLCVGNWISSQRLILICGNCFEHASMLIVRFIRLSWFGWVWHQYLIWGIYFSVY